MSAVIQTKKLTKFYGKARGIIDVDLTVNEGEIFGFIGPNGAGKSTTSPIASNKSVGAYISLLLIDSQKDIKGLKRK